MKAYPEDLNTINNHQLILTAFPNIFYHNSRYFDDDLTTCRDIHRYTEKNEPLQPNFITQLNQTHSGIYTDLKYTRRIRVYSKNRFEKYHPVINKNPPIPTPPKREDFDDDLSGEYKFKTAQSKYRQIKNIHHRTKCVVQTNTIRTNYFDTDHNRLSKFVDILGQIRKFKFYQHLYPNQLMDHPTKNKLVKSIGGYGGVKKTKAIERLVKTYVSIIDDVTPLCSDVIIHIVTFLVN